MSVENTGKTLVYMLIVTGFMIPMFTLSKNVALEYPEVVL